MHRPGVVGDEHSAALDHRHQLTDRGLAREQDRLCPHPVRNGPTQGLLAPCSDNHHAHAARPVLLHQPIRRLGKAFRQPSLGASVSGARIESHDEVGFSDTGFDEPPSHGVLLAIRKKQSGGIRLPARTERPKEIQVILDLMDTVGPFRYRDRIGQQQAPTIRGVPIAAGNPGQERQQGRLKGILEQNRQVEPQTAQCARQRPLAGQAGMLSAVVIHQNPVETRMTSQQLCNRRLDQHRDLSGRKQPAQRAQRRLAHDGIADPVGSPHQQSLDGGVTRDA